MSDIKAREVQWYMKNGRYKKDRIEKDSRGEKYVIGDYSWNKTNPSRVEFIEHDMVIALINEKVF